MKEVFYPVALLRSALDNGEETQTSESKQYLPHDTTQEQWMDHFGDKEDLFDKRKMGFDPRRILSTGQRIFKLSFISDDDEVAEGSVRPRTHRARLSGAVILALPLGKFGLASVNHCLFVGLIAIGNRDI